MPQIKADIEIGRRMYEESIRLFGSVPKAAKALGAERKTPWSWDGGATPQTRFLVRLHYAGGDVMYVLTGKRS